VRGGVDHDEVGADLGGALQPVRQPPVLDALDGGKLGLAVVPPLGSRGLRVKIEDQHVVAGRGGHGGEMDGERRLPGPALLVDEADDARLRAASPFRVGQVASP
jgi:hypothetical protein